MLTTSVADSIVWHVRVAIAQATLNARNAAPANRRPIPAGGGAQKAAEAASTVKQAKLGWNKRKSSEYGTVQLNGSGHLPVDGVVLAAT